MRVFPPPCWFSRNNLDTVKAVNLALSNFSGDTCKTWHLTGSSLQIFDKTQAGVFSVSRFLVKFPINKNCQNSRNSNDTAMKLRLVTKKINQHQLQSQKKLAMTSCR